jgi:hypothetical protein
MMQGADVQSPEADRLLAMARTKARLGRVQPAVMDYDRALALRPGLEEAFVEVVDLLGAAHDWAGVAQRCETWIAHHPDHGSHRISDRAHSLRIDALCRVGGIELAMDAYGVEPVTGGAAEVDADEIVAVIPARNERSRFPYLLEHHRRLGVDRFLVLDNGSDDGSVDHLLGEPDTIVWQTTRSHREANCGAAWADLLLRRHAAPQQWCLTIDADELLVYPGCERRGLRELCADLDREGATCYQAIHVDMYGDGRLSETTYRPGQDPVEVYPYFDGVYYRRRIPFDGPRRNITNYWGGVRGRMFGGSLGGFLLNKTPLFRYAPGQLLMSGFHWLDRPTGEIAAGRGALLHFKFNAVFADVVAEELVRKEYSRGSAVFEVYARGLDATPDPVFFDPMHSVRYESSEQLVRMGVMRNGPSDERVPVTRDGVLIPAIPAPPPATAATDRPFWSVIVIARGPDDTRDRVEHALRALEGAPPSEVLVVVGPGMCGDVPSRNVVVVPTPHHLNDIESANIGLCHSRGSWVHVLGSDLVGPAFYAAMGDAIAGGGAVAVAHGCGTALDFAMRPSRFVANRELYEVAGGFCATIPCAAAWEGLQRLAHTAGMAPVSVPMSPPGPEGRANGPSAGYGEEVRHWLAAIDLVGEMASLAPPDLASLRDRCALQAADLVRDDVEHGRFGSALATVGEVLRAPLSPPAHEHLTTALLRLQR